jgi:hypothetical protein
MNFPFGPLFGLSRVSALLDPTYLRAAVLDLLVPQTLLTPKPRFL